VFPRASDIDRQAQQTCQDEKSRDPAYDIICIKPANHLANIAPEFPAQDESDGKSEERLASRFFSGSVTSDGDDTNVE
jgi:hypothetical protein